MIILAFLFVLDGLSLWLVARFDYNRTLDHAAVVLQKTAISLEERVKRTITATEAILQSRVIRLQESSIGNLKVAPGEHERLKRAAQALPDPGSLWLLDARGGLVMDSTQYPSQKANFAEREYFTLQKNDGVRLYIGPVVKGKITKKYSFTISHRIDGKKGEFLGILVAAIDADDFTNFLHTINLGEDSAVAVFRTDGVLIFRQPMYDEYLDKNYKNLKLFTLSFESAPSGVYETNRWMDNTPRFVAYRKIEGRPLVVATSIPTRSLLEEWHSRLRYYTGIAIAIFFALTGLSWFAYKTVSREEKEKSKEITEINRSLASENAERRRAEEQLKSAHEELELRVRQRTHELNAANKQLRALSARLLSIREDERTRISREIHDELGQALTGLKMDLSWLVRKPPEDGGSLAKKIKPMTELINNTIRTVRRISTELRPGVLDDLGLAAAIEWLVEDFKNRTKIECTSFADLKNAVIGPDLSTALFRILQEALTNVIRHADATHVTINVTYSAGVVVLEIEDNGKGIAERDIRSTRSLGILGIRERALFFGGQANIAGVPGKGTTLMIKVPLEITSGE
jgi:signal transduction histidine kinase